MPRGLILGIIDSLITTKNILIETLRQGRARPTRKVSSA